MQLDKKLRCAFGERLWPHDPQKPWARRNAMGDLVRHKKNPKTAYTLGGTKFVASLRFLSRAATCRGMGPPGPT
jgi:hypothetical protein